MENIMGVTEFLRKKIIAEGGDPDRETLTLIYTTDGKPYYYHNDGEYYRVYKFIENAKSYDIVENPDQLYHALSENSRECLRTIRRISSTRQL